MPLREWGYAEAKGLDQAAHLDTVGCQTRRPTPRQGSALSRPSREFLQQTSRR